MNYDVARTPAFDNGVNVITLEMLLIRHLSHFSTVVIENSTLCREFFEKRVDYVGVGFPA